MARDLSPFLRKLSKRAETNNADDSFNFSLKTKSKQKNEGSVGLYTYPVLQAADILLYR